jgi:hypothetical protein
MQTEKAAYDDFFGLNDIPTEDVIIQKDNNFSTTGNGDFDILNPLEKKEEVIVEKKEQNQEEVDILESDKKEEKEQEDITNIVNFFQERVKKGIFSNLVDEEGNDVTLSKVEDIDSFLEANFNYRVEKEKETLETTWYETKSPAWKAVAQYADYVQDPTQLIPFLQGVNNIMNISEVDETTIEGAESIVRFKMQASGDDEETIEEQIKILKDSDKIVDIAKRYKPALVQSETQRLSQMQEKAKKDQDQYIESVRAYEKLAIENIEKPLFGEKLNQEEKAIIYDMIAIPNQELGGYAIFSAIDDLYEKQDMETLREIALLIANKQKFYTYASKAATVKTAADLQRKLRVQLESDKKSSSKDDPEITNVKAPTYKQQGKPRFGF